MTVEASVGAGFPGVGVTLNWKPISNRYWGPAEALCKSSKYFNLGIISPAPTTLMCKLDIHGFPSRINIISI